MLVLTLAAATATTKFTTTAKVTTVFSTAEVEQCGNIRIPQMTVTPSGVLLAAQCRKANHTTNSTGLGDDMVRAKVVTKFSSDLGQTWGPMKVLTPIAHSHGQVVYDAVRKRVLLRGHPALKYGVLFVDGDDVTGGGLTLEHKIAGGMPDPRVPGDECAASGDDHAAPGDDDQLAFLEKCKSS